MVGRTSAAAFKVIPVNSFREFVELVYRMRLAQLQFERAPSPSKGKAVGKIQAEVDFVISSLRRGRPIPPQPEPPRAA